MLSAIDNNQHINALSELAGMIEDQEFLKVLDTAKSTQDIMNYIINK